MIRHQNFLESGKLPKIEQVISSRKHLLFRSYQKGSLQTHLTKRIKAKDQLMMDYYKIHVINNIMPYLRNVSLGSQRDPLKMSSSIFQVMIQGKELDQAIQQYDYNSESDQQNSNPQIDGSTLFLSKRMIQGKTLKEIIIKKDPRLDDEFSLDLVGALVDFVLQANGVKDLMITSENIIVSEIGEFHLNYLSFVGIDFFRLDKYISREEFEEILPYLTTGFMKDSSPGTTKISFEMQIKFLMMNFYMTFFKRDLAFDLGMEIEIELRKNDQKVANVVNKIEKEIYPQLFSQKEQQEIRQLDKKHQTHYEDLLINCMKEEKFINNWQQVIARLSKAGLIIAEKMINTDGLFSFYSLERNQNRFAQNSLQIFDIHITIMKILETIKVKNESGTSNFKDIKRKYLQLFKEKNSLIEEGRYSKSLYIPIKFGMKFTEILKYKNWVHMLNSSVDADSSTLISITRLIKFCLQIRDHMVQIEPYLNVSLFQEILKNKSPEIGSEVFEQSFYMFIATQIQKEDDEENNQSKLKVQFWEKLFWILNQLMLLAKKFFLKTTQHNIHKLKINRHDFNSIIQLIDDSIPPLSTQPLQPPQSQPEDKISNL